MFKRSGKRRRTERGAALVEFAIVLPILIGLFGAVIDFGDAWFTSTSVQSGVRNASVVGFDAGVDYDHDYRVVRSVMDELDNRGIETINRVVIYDPSAFTGDLPAGCYATAETGGVAGVCNSYSGAFLERVANGTARDEFVAGNCASSADSSWCATTRGGGLGTAFNVGVEVSVSHSALIGFMPFFQEYDIAKSSVISEIAR